MPAREENDEIKKRQKELRAEGLRMSFHATKRLLATEKRLAAAIEQKQPATDEPNPFDEKIQLKLEQARPSFLSDGLGLRGPQNPLTNLSIDGADGRGRDMQVKREAAPAGGGGGMAAEGSDFSLTLTNTGSGADLASLSGGDALSVVRVRDTASVTAAIVTGALELTVVPLEGEGVFAESLGIGAVQMIIDSGAVLVDTISVKSLDSEGAILLVESSGTVTIHWTYADIGGGLTLIKELNALDGAVFYTINDLGEQGIAVQLVDDMLQFEFKGANAGGEEEIYIGLDPSEGAQFRTFKAVADKGITVATDGETIGIGAGVFTPTMQGMAPISGGGTDNFLRADGQWVEPPSGDGITQLTGDVTTPIDSTGNGVVATIALLAVSSAKMTAAGPGGTGGVYAYPDSITVDIAGRVTAITSGDGIPPGYEEVDITFCDEGTPTTITILKKV